MQQPQSLITSPNFCYGQCIDVPSHEIKKSSFCNFDPKPFEKDLESINLNTILQPPSGNLNLSSQLSSQLFFCKAENFLDKNCPFKNLLIRELKKKQKSLIMAALSKSIRIKIKFQKTILKQPTLIGKSTTLNIVETGNLRIMLTKTFK